MIKEKSVIYFDTASDHTFPFAQSGSPLLGLDGTPAKAELFLKEITKQDLNKKPLSKVTVNGNSVIIDMSNDKSFHGDTWIQVTGSGTLLDGKPLIIVDATDVTKLICRFPDNKTLDSIEAMVGFVSIWAPKLDGITRNNNSIYFLYNGIGIWNDMGTNKTYIGVGPNISIIGNYNDIGLNTFRFADTKFIMIYNEDEIYFIEPKSNTANTVAYWTVNHVLRISKTDKVGEFEINASFINWYLCNPSQNIFFKFATITAANWTDTTTDIGILLSYPTQAVLTDMGTYYISRGNPQFIGAASISNDRTLKYRYIDSMNRVGYYFTPKTSSTPRNCPYLIYTRIY